MLNPNEIKLDRVLCGDSRKILSEFPDNFFDSVVTDPPYEIGFCNRAWDSSGIAFDPKFWGEVLRVSKPGATMFCFGGSRTYHRIACAIEDAGWEIRDSLAFLWAYGSGFPKSHDISKAIDKSNGAKREVIGSRLAPDIRNNNLMRISQGLGGAKMIYEYTAPSTDLAKQWSGYGTALKPSFEIILGAEKPITIKDFAVTLVHRLKDVICQLKSYAKIVEKISLLNRQGQNVIRPDSALWTVVEKSNTPEDLLGLMGTWPSESEIPLSLSIGLSWLSMLAEIYTRENTFTTEMVISLTTDLKILNSLRSKITPDCLIRAATGQLGIGSSAELVASIFSAANAKVKNTYITFVQDNVISRARISCQDGPVFEPIILAQKSLDGTFAQNAKKWGVAGLNIDAGRIGTEEDSEKYNAFEEREQKGRWPANIILSHSSDCVHVGTKQIGKGKYNDNITRNAKPSWKNSSKDIRHITYGQETIDVWACVPDCPIRIMDSQSGQSKSTELKYAPKEAKRHGDALQLNTGNSKWIDGMGGGYKDSGGASRFFYCTKASRTEREFGLKDILPCVKCGQIGTETHNLAGSKENCIRNNHPTVKPLDLLIYLCKLIKMPGRENERPQVILDSFCGSGTTLLAAQKLGLKYIGIDQEAEHTLIATARRIDEEPNDDELIEDSIELPDAELLSSSDFEDLIL